jgi:signal transduction histidine kinase
VLGLADTLRLGIYGPLTERQVKPVALVQANGQRLLALVTDVLDSTTLEAGTVTLQLAETALAGVCAASVAAVRAAAEAKQIRLSTHIDSALSTVRADRQRLEQILVKLLENAIKFTPEDGAVGVAVTPTDDQRAVQFTVWDTGIGIAPEDQARVFDPFTQADSRLARTHEGAGLGLALVRHLVEMHGGQVTVASAGVPGQGSRFTVSLPA